MAHLEFVLQNCTAYAVSQGTPEARIIEDEKEVVGPSGAKYKTSKGLATNIANAGAALAAGITQLGALATHGIINAGKWWRSNVKPNEVPTQVSATTLKRRAVFVKHTCVCYVEHRECDIQGIRSKLKRHTRKEVKAPLTEHHTLKSSQNIP